MRIVFVNISGAYGGVEHVVETYAHELCLRGHELLYMCNTFPGADRHLNRLHQDGVHSTLIELTGQKVYLPRCEPHSMPAGFINKRKPNAFSSMIRQNSLMKYKLEFIWKKRQHKAWKHIFKPIFTEHIFSGDIIVFHAGFYGWLPGACRAVRETCSKCRTVLILGNEPVFYRPGYEERKMFTSYLDVSVFVSNTLKMEWLNIARCRRKKVFVLPNPVNIQEIRKKIASTSVPGRKKGVHLVTLGRLSEVKGLDVLIHALLWLTEHHPEKNFFLSIIGDGPYRYNLEALVRDCAINDVVTFLGEKENPYPFLKSADIFVQPSLHEGFGVSIVEAMLMTIPVVASSVGGIPDTLHNGEYGMLVPPGDARALATAILQLASDKLLADGYAVKACAYAEKTFDASRITGKLVDMIQGKIA